MPVDDHRIVNRKFILAPNIEPHRVHEVTTQCSSCKQYFAACFRKGSYHGLDAGLPCHNYKLVFTDGACSNNGYGNAIAGMGIVMGAPGPERQWSVPIDDTVDPGGPRTNQRAELLAAIRGLRLIHMQEMIQAKTHRDNSSVAHSNESALRPCGPLDHITFVVVTDSQYVAEGITTWFPRWKAKSWLNSRGTRPANLDLFRSLDLLITTLEFTGIKVGFWKIGRGDNHEADSLAKTATCAS